ncbi:MAG: DUF3108 domain-containing protein [Candidatus Eisenbacteria bacterium]|nr:DUF3108 domain-containing protein [Candidatus Eisenbacteria bacterium]
MPSSPGDLHAAALAVLLSVALVAPAPAADSTLAPPPDSGDITASVLVPGPGGRQVLPPAAEPFRIGESLKFSVQYGFIHAGSAWLEVPAVRDWSGRPVYQLVARAESNAFFSRFYKVRNRIESYWDRHGLYSWRYFEDRREGRFKTRSEIVFDHDRNQAVYDDGRVFPTPPRVQDALSSFYYTRFQALPLGGSVVFDYHASRKSQPLRVKVLGRERIETPAGTFDCVAIEPILKAGGIFKNQGRLVIWITDDSRRMPVLMKSKVIIGSISVVLVDARPGT